VAVQVEFTLDHPAAAPQLAERRSRHAGSREEQFLAGGNGSLPVPRVGESVDENLLLVAQALAGNRLWSRPRGFGPVDGRQRGSIGDRAAE